MTQYNVLNVKLSNSQLNKLKSAIKNETEVTVNLSKNALGDSNDKNNFQHKFFLTNTPVSRLCKVFANNSSANIKLSKTQLQSSRNSRKILQSRGFLGRRLGLLLKTGLPLIGNALKFRLSPSKKNVLFASMIAL